tara:strand:+ start:43 stop:303 length:261 start_codon:yes stop_codon:yes gene_type:complete
MSKIKMTKAFVRNITDDFVTGIGYDVHNSEDIEDLFNNKEILIEYTEHCLGMYKAISCDSDPSEALRNYAMVKCYRSFLSKVKGGK